MPYRHRLPVQPALRVLLKPTASSAPLAKYPWLLALNQCRCQSAGKGEDLESFKGQLYKSTAQRLERERVEQRRFAKERGESSQGRSLAITFAILTASLTCYYFGTLNPAPPSTTSTTSIAASQPPRHNTAPANLQAAWAEFVAILGAENVSTEKGDLEYHSGSEWSSHATTSRELPFLIVYPETTEDVSKIMRICHQRKIPVTPFSGGTSIEGNFFPTRGGICIDFKRMGKILALHKNDLDVVVQPALGWETLNEELMKDNLFFPPDPGPGAMIGGMVGTGCSGTNAYRYGTMKDWVVSLTVVLADGTIIKTRQRPRKSSAGYDLTRLFIGSEGTLGLVTEAVLRVTVRPKSESVAVASFSTIRDAATCVAKVVGEGIPIAAVELLDDVQMKCINASGITSRTWKEEPTLFFKFGGTASGVKEQVGLVQKISKSNGGKSFEFARSDAEMHELWSARKAALWSVMAMRRDEGDHVWTTDVAVPISRLPDIIEETKSDISRSGLVGAIVGHVGDGNFHSILLFNEKERKIVEEVVHRMVKRAIEMEGTVTGEHGVGLVKRDYLKHELGESTVDAMRKIKQAYDPLCLLNSSTGSSSTESPSTASPTTTGPVSAGSSTATGSSAAVTSGSATGSATKTDSTSSSTSSDGALAPWISIPPDGTPVTITPVVTAISGVTTTIGAGPVVAGSATSTVIVPTSGSFPVCHNSSGPSPFCHPSDGKEVWVGETYYVTWDPSYKFFNVNSTISILLNYANESGGGREAWQSGPRANSYGFVSVKMEDRWRKGQSKNNLTFYLVEVKSGLGPARYIEGPTISLVAKPIEHYKPPPPTRPPNKLGLEIGLPVSLGFISLVVCGLWIGMRKHRAIGLGNINIGRNKGYGIGKSHRQRMKRSKRAGPIRLDDDDNVMPPSRDGGFRDDPMDGGVELAEQRPKPHARAREDSLGSLVDSPTEGEFGRERLRNNAFRDEVARQKAEGR
ncbi:MAG: D-lactate ferricytochrome c oxidoreductase [Geoglossum simile]|nr:MAG: D-lactate ferricytochrome c oxidoreductase [Geoglossum simile]